jgi:hypothetical protein
MNLRELFAKTTADFAGVDQAMRRVAAVLNRLAAMNHPEMDPPALPAHLATWENEGGAVR